MTILQFIKFKPFKGETQVQARQYHEGSSEWIKDETSTCEFLVGIQLRSQIRGQIGVKFGVKVGVNFGVNFDRCWWRF